MFAFFWARPFRKRKYFRKTYMSEAFSVEISKKFFKYMSGPFLKRGCLFWKKYMIGAISEKRVFISKKVHEWGLFEKKGGFFRKMHMGGAISKKRVLISRSYYHHLMIKNINKLLINLSRRLWRCILRKDMLKVYQTQMKHTLVKSSKDTIFIMECFFR